MQKINFFLLFVYPEYFRAISESGLKQLKRIELCIWATPLWRPIKGNRCFGVTYRLHLQGRRVSQAWNQYKPGSKYTTVSLWANLLPRIPPAVGRTIVSSLEICCPHFEKKKSWWRQSIPSALSFSFLRNEITRVSSDKQIRKQTNSDRIRNSVSSFSAFGPSHMT
jgi:hypothetical protein